ncbi:Kelch repeat protein [Aspergillus stella-maris]|uniref:Kelch repeat protein n=1 Tax=Aspergillus stella-maris TaxID=1810926 RepID=UPI003CCCC21F
MVRAIWKTLLSDASIQRSSQTLSVVGNNAYIYGGELRPREPVDSAVYRIPMNQGEASSTDLFTVKDLPNTPQPRVGAASTTINKKIYIFSGRGGTAMAPIEETGAFWVFDTTASNGEWSQLRPTDSQAPYPAGRSYHAQTSNGQDTIFVHAGCPEKGRLADLWAFDINTHKWSELPAAPGLERGGTSIAYYDGKVYRMNGFDGKTEQGGALDIFNLAINSWSTVTYDADGVKGPSPRSVACLLPVTVNGKPSLVTMFGEHDPSSLGHQGAGKMLSDVWVFDIDSKAWTKAETEGDTPPPRGWFDADVTEAGSIVVHGGLAESNERLGDIWLLEIAA